MQRLRWQLLDCCWGQRSAQIRRLWLRRECSSRNLREFTAHWRDVLERELLAKLQASVLSPAAISYLLGRLELELSKRFTRIVGMVPRARIGLATPAFSGPRSTGELPRHRWVEQFYGNSCGVTNENTLHRNLNHCGPGPAARKTQKNAWIPDGCYFTESSYSFIQFLFFKTSRALDPSAGPTMPSFSIKSIRRAARP